jgi:glucose-1-phosphate thymidylyltransferase
MKGILLAGGTGSRLSPLTKVTNKHLLPVYDKPMIYYPLQTLIDCGCKEIMVVTGKDHGGAIMNLLGSGKDFDVNIHYAIQDRAGGIAEALGLCENFVNDDNMLVILGDNIFLGNTPKVEAFNDTAQIFLYKHDNPERFGVAELFPNGKVKSIEEKPKEPKSNLIVTGLYVYPSSVFDFIKTLDYSDRGELEITDVNNLFIERGLMRSEVLDCDWTDAGTFDSLVKATEKAYLYKH